VLSLWKRAWVIWLRIRGGGAGKRGNVRDHEARAESRTGDENGTGKRLRVINKGDSCGEVPRAKDVCVMVAVYTYALTYMTHML
jgi:hypothetical protein